MNDHTNTVRRTSDYDLFLSNTVSRVTSDQAQVIRRMYDIAVAESWDIGWGPGNAMTYFSIGIPSLKNEPVMSVWIFGHLLIDYDKLNDSTIAERVRKSLAMFAAEHFEEAVRQTCNDDEFGSEEFVVVDPEDWMPKVVDVIKYLRTLSAIDCK